MFKKEKREVSTIAKQLEDSNTKTVSTSCQIPLSIKDNEIAEKRADKSNNQTRLIRELLTAFLNNQKDPISSEDLLKDKNEELVYIPLLLPEDLRDDARKFALASHISFGALIRHILYVEFGTSEDRKQAKKTSKKVTKG